MAKKDKSKINALEKFDMKTGRSASKVDKSKSALKIKSEELTTPKMHVPVIPRVAEVNKCETPKKGLKREPMDKTPSLGMKKNVEIMKEFLWYSDKEMKDNISEKESVD